MAVTVIVGVTGSLGAPLVPELTEIHGVSLSTAQWSLTAPFIVGAVAAPVFGRLGSGRRRRPAVLGIVALALVGSVLAALADSIALVIAGRALQGLAFAAQPLLFSLARDHLDGERLRRALGSLSVANVVSAGLGFPATAVVVHLWGLSAGFWLAVVLLTIVLVVAWTGVPASVEDPAEGVDVPGVVLLVGGLVSLLLLTSRGHVWGYGSPVGIGLVCSSVILLGASLWWFRRARFPLVDVSLATGRGVLGLHVATLLLAVGTYIVLGSVAVAVQAPESSGYGMGRSVVVAGLMLVPYALGGFVGNIVSRPVVRWFGPMSVLPIGCLMVAASNGSLALWHDQVWQVVVAMTLSGVGSGFGFQSIPWLMAQAVPAADIGPAMGLNVVVRFAGFGLGGAISGAVLEALGGGGDATGFVTVMTIGAGIGLGAAVIVAAMLRGSPATQGVPTLHQ